MQTYANLCVLAAFAGYAFNDAKIVGKAAHYFSILAVVAFVVTEGIALFQGSHA